MISLVASIKGGKYRESGLGKGQHLEFLPRLKMSVPDRFFVLQKPYM